MVKHPQAISEILKKNTSIKKPSPTSSIAINSHWNKEAPIRRDCLADIQNNNKLFKAPLPKQKPAITSKNNLSLATAVAVDETTSFPTPLPSPVLSPSFKASAKKRVMKKTERKQRRRETLMNWRLKKKAKQAAEALQETNTESPETAENVEEKPDSGEANGVQLKNTFFETKLGKEDWSFVSTPKIK